MELGLGLYISLLYPLRTPVRFHQFGGGGEHWRETGRQEEERRARYLLAIQVNGNPVKAFSLTAAAVPTTRTSRLAPRWGSSSGQMEPFTESGLQLLKLLLPALEASTPARRCLSSALLVSENPNLFPLASQPWELYLCATPLCPFHFSVLPKAFKQFSTSKSLC